MLRPTIAAAAALLALLTIIWLPTDQAATQSSLSAMSASADGDSLTITLSAQADATSTAAASDFTVTAGASTLAVDSAGVSGSTITLTLAEAVGDPDCDSSAISVSYTKSASSITASGEALADFTALSVANQTDNAPAIDSIETDSTGRYIYVNFCEPLTNPFDFWFHFQAFVVRVEESPVAINVVTNPSATPTQIRIDLTTNKAVEEGESVTLAYDQSKGNRDSPLADFDQGNKPVESWSARAVTNNVDSPPSLKSATALYDVVTLTFSEALDENSVPDADAFSIRGTQHAPTVQVVSVSNETVTLNLSGILSQRGSPTYTVRYTAPNESPLRQEDGAHDVGDFTSSTFDSSTPTAKPMVTGAEVDGSTLKITFDLPLKNVAPASAFTIGGQSGVMVTATAVSGSVVTLTLSPAVSAGATITVSYAKPGGPPRVEGRNNKDADRFTNRAVTNNTIAPAPEFSSAAVSADGATLTITFTLALDESAEHVPAASTFSLSGTGAAVDSVSISGTDVALTLEPPADAGETITVGYTQPSAPSASRLQAAADAQAVATFSGQAVTNHADGKPRPTSAEVNGDRLTISFDRGLDAASVPAASAFSLGGTTATVASVVVSGSTATLTLSAAVAYTDTVTVGYAKPDAGGLKRLGRSVFADGFSALSVTNNTPDPRPAFASAAVNTAGDRLTILMSKNLLTTAAGTPAGSAFTISGGSAAITSVSVGGRTVSLALSPPADVGDTITIAYTQPSEAGAGKLQAQTGGHLAETWSAQSVTNQTDGKPRPVEGTVVGASLALRFDRSIDESQSPPNADFTVTPTGITVTGISIDGATLTLTLSKAVAHDDAVTVSYSAAGTNKLKRDGRPIFADAFSGFAVENNTPEPLVRSVVGDGAEIVVSFSVALDVSSAPDGSAFSLGSGQPSISSVALSVMAVTLTLSASLVEGEAYTLTYRAPMGSPLQRSGGAAIPDLSEAVTNNTDVPPTVERVVGNAATLTITFDQPLKTTAVIAATSFSLSGDAQRTVSGSSIDGAGLSLTLSSALKEDETASVTYTRPSQNGIVDPTGNQAENFSEAIDNQTDTAPQPVSGTVEDDTIVIILDQDIYEDMRFKQLAADSVLLQHFTFTGTDAVVRQLEISNGGPGGVGKIVITLSQAVAEDDSITVRYFPSSGSIRIRDNDAGRNRAQINNYQLENLTASAPAFESATLDGTSLTVRFDRALDADAEPSASWFALTPSGLAIQSATIDGLTLKLEVSPAAKEDEEVTLTYTAPATGGLQGENGLAVTGLENAVDVDNETDTAPVPTKIYTDDMGEFVFITFDQRLDPSGTIDHSWFVLDPATEIDSVVIDPDVSGEIQLKVILGDDGEIREGSSLKLTYTAPASGGLRDDDGDPQAQGDGNPVASFTIDVKNDVDVAPQLESITVDGRVVTLDFDQDLDPGQVPPTCQQLLDLMLQIEDLDCRKTEELPWFTVRVVGSGSVPIDDVAIEGSTVMLQMRDRIGRTDSVTVRYEPTSGSPRSLRDTSMHPEHTVGRFEVPSSNFGESTIENITPAHPSSVEFDRATPSQIVIKFDGDLVEAMNLDAGPVTVTVDGAPTAIQRVGASGSELTITLFESIPECVDVRIEYSSEVGDWMDRSGRAIDSFSLPVDNFINADWKLQCVRSDFGGLVLTFADPGFLNRQGLEWNLSVDGEERALTVSVEDDVVELRPSTSICAGDSVEVGSPDVNEAEALVPRRTISRAAPCTVSAAADSVRLRVTFDGPLGAALPEAADFTVSGGAAVEGIVSVEGRVLTIRLAHPGVRAGQKAVLSYAGTSLTGSGLTVGPFEVSVSDRTTPPELESAYAFGASVFLKFDQPLYPREVSATRFIPTGPGIEEKVKSVSIGGSSVYLELTSSLSDEPDLFGLVYLARTSGGLAGLTGARVDDSVFLVENRTETAPTVESAVVRARTITVTFDQRVEATDAQVSDFTVIAGRRAVAAASLEWSRDGVVIGLAERVTSLDAVRLVYAPAAPGSVRDLSGLALKPFEFWAENRTPTPGTIAGRVEDARLRSANGETTLERELARGFATDDGIRATAAPGEGQTAFVRRDLTLSVDAASLGDEPTRISVAPLRQTRSMLQHFAAVPSYCRNSVDAAEPSAWLVGQSDVHGVPTDLSARVTLLGAEADTLPASYCVLDLISGTWRLGRPGRLGETFIGPSLILERRRPLHPSEGLWPLAG